MDTMTLPPPTDLRRRDEIWQRAAEASQEAGPSKRLARALGISLRWAQEARKGERPAPPQRVLEFFDSLSRGSGVDPWPLVGTVIQTVQEGQLARVGWTPREAYLELCPRETRRQAEADILQMELRSAWCPELLERYRVVGRRHAWKVLGMVAAAEMELRGRTS